MLLGYSPVSQALLGTFLTWGLTAAGAALVFVFSSGQRRILDGSLGFAAGVMLAASYWSLLAPAIELAEDSGKFGALAFFPVAVGFILGAAFVYIADLLLPWLVLQNNSVINFNQKSYKAFVAPPVQFYGQYLADVDHRVTLEDLEIPRVVFSQGISEPPYTALALSCDSKVVKEKYEQPPLCPWEYENELTIRIGRTALHSDKSENGEPYQRRKGAGGGQPDVPAPSQTLKDNTPMPTSCSWRRIMLLILAITIHNIPEGLAVGVGFGAVGKSASATFESARNLAIGIGIQNFPEGLAVSLPLRGAGFSTWRAFWYGQLSGMVEPLAGLFGAFAMVLAEPLLPYALAFAAGAMVYVVMDDIIPEAQISGNGKLASWTAIFGFVIMMSLDVGLG